MGFKGNPRNILSKAASAPDSLCSRFQSRMPCRYFPLRSTPKNRGIRRTSVKVSSRCIEASSVPGE